MLEGDISQINLIARLVELWREQFTGAIRFENDGIIKIIYFKGGDVLSASTNDRADSIDEILMRANKVTREHVKQALAKRKENETLGDALLNLGFITRKELSWARRVQVVGVVRSIAAWTDGSFTIVADYLPKRDEGTLFPLPQVIVELIVTEQDRQRFERAMDGGNAVFEKAADFEDVFRRLGLNEDAQQIVDEIDGTITVAEVATMSGKDTFNVYKLVHALSLLGILTPVQIPQATPQFSLDDFATAGVADAADMWGTPSEQPAMTFEPAPVAGAPMFELDEAEAVRQPTLEIPAMAILPSEDVSQEPQPMSFETEAVPEETPAPEPVWSAPPVEEAPPTPAAKMPGWDTPPREPMAVPIPAPIPPAGEASEEQWGFDEAQIETARRAAVPVAAADAPVATAFATPQRPRSKPARRSRYGLIVTLLGLLILGGLGYFGFLWWQDQQAPEPTPVVTKRPRPKITPRTATPPATATIVPITETTVTTATTASVAPSTPLTITPEPAPPIATATQAPLPTVTPIRPPASGDRARYDELARQYAANPQGNFTVQIQILCDPGNLGKAMRAGGDSVWFVPQTIGGRSCYRVFWGRYGTRAEAQGALAQIPAALRDPNAAVKAVPRG